MHLRTLVSRIFMSWMMGIAVTQAAEVAGYKPVNVGRLILQVPSAWEVTSAEYWVEGIKITEQRETHLDNARAKQLWQTRIIDIKAERRGAAQWQAKIVSDQSLSNQARILIYHPPSNEQQFITAEVLLQKSSFAVWLKLEELTKRASVEQLTQRMRELAKQYEVSELSSGPGFYTLHAKIAASSGKGESAYVSLNTGEPDHSFKITAYSTHKDGKNTLLDRTPQMDEDVDKEFSGLAVKERAGSRTVAGLDGEEIIYYYQEPFEQKTKIETIFKWQYAGRKQTADQPKVNIEWQGPTSDVEGKIKIWDKVLGSVMRR